MTCCGAPMRRFVFLTLAMLGCSSNEPSEQQQPATDSSSVEDTFVASDTPAVTKTVIRVHYPAGGKTISLRGSGTVER